VDKKKDDPPVFMRVSRLLKMKKLTFLDLTQPLKSYWLFGGFFQFP